MFLNKLTIGLHQPIRHSFTIREYIVYQKKLPFNGSLKQTRQVFKNFYRGNKFKQHTIRQELTPPIKLPINAENNPANPSILWKPIVFSGIFVVGTFVGVSIWEYERSTPFRLYKHNIERVRRHFNKHTQNAQTNFQLISQWWNSLTPGDRIFVPLCAINCLVFGLWRIPKIQPFMLKYFCSNPIAKAVCWPMLLSTFSHYSTLHLFANMYVLNSFANPVVMTLGYEQFLGLYLSAGVLASLSSYLYKVAFTQVGLSLGASGAIMGILAFVCTQFPDTQLGIIFVPMLSFSAGSAIKVLIGVDLAGCILRWKFFDHAAHLGGAFVGMFWSYVGVNQIWPKRKYIHQYWEQLKSSK